ncbi:error-prone DNA polymerase [Bowdeniella nasicola]|uniref:Error-prone DNA polymerase n=1 Tax=Bowdeniella nasicola TaxID=208480 RepID=A0A1Q5Q510_9ACTO|nr:error-prone DNA polymerase [Bowdeniella nasicola]OKL54779.1 error-prone DNA polymerase [Bowdeniella nasicola]
MTSYAELHSHSAFTFLRGANEPAELVERAAELELTALALTDRDGLYGVIQHARAAAEVGLAAVTGAELTTTSPTGPTNVVALARNAVDYAHLSRTLAAAHLATGDEHESRQRDLRVDLAELAAGGDFLILTGGRDGYLPRLLHEGTARAGLDRLIALFGKESVAIEIVATGRGDDAHLHDALADLARDYRVPLVATGDVYCARPEDFPLLTALQATSHNASLTDADAHLPPAPAYLRGASEMARLHRRHPQAVATAAALGTECAFDLSLIAPNLPPHPVPDGHSEASWLRELTMRGAEQRYGPPHAERVPGAYRMIEHELAIIEELGFPGYFLIVHEIVAFCRRNNILCQGRGSAANSAVCFALGITAVDAVTHKLLFERFLSPGRSGPPDIDVDIESGRREEVIQFVYRRYGRSHAALVANVITYRTRSAVRDAARALGYSAGASDAMTKKLERWGAVDEGVPAPVADLAERFMRLPRHLGIHPGGMVLCDRPVVDVCPIQWAAMPGRTVLQWDKDDCADAGLVKFDLLGLGMLTALRYAFNDLAARGITHDGRRIDLHDIPQEDPGVYDLLCAADTVGVFQVESRAQMQTLPRMAPRCFYDIVVEVALIRPGPIQGGSVNPYLRRRLGREEVTYLHPLLKPALEKTLGVPLFQEQLMQIAVDAAGFTPAQADKLRKAMGAKRSLERMAALHDQLIIGMAERGISGEVAEQIYATLEGFASFGFPESHSFSFAYLVYASAYLKVHHPEAFYAGLLAAQPMGFYSPASLVADARRHGVTVLPADVLTSDVHASVVAHEGERHPEYDESVARLVHPSGAVLLGLAPIRGIGEQAAERIVAARAQRPFSDPMDLAARARLSVTQIENLASAGALQAFGSRREMLWSATWTSGRRHRSGDVVYEQLPIPGIDTPATLPELPALTTLERSVLDVRATGTSKEHPITFVRPQLRADGIYSIAEFGRLPDGMRARTAGVVTHRQRPGTASGITFLALEDETGILNVVCSPGVWQAYRPIARGQAALIIRGVVQKADGVIALRADRFEPLSLAVPSTSRDFH